MYDMAMRRRLAVFFFVLASLLPARNRIAYVEFFGYQGVDLDAVRKALPFHEGDAVSSKIKEQARAAVRAVAGRDATDVTSVCCTGDGDSVIFIGLPGASSQAFTLYAAPKGNIAPAAALAALYRKLDRAESAALMKGQSEEDGAPGYRLSKEPGARAAELAVRQYALHHEDELIHLLEASAKAESRATGADALGYGARSARQMAALVHAARDPDSNVRNNSTRALTEILRADPSAAAQIPPENFLDMIRSGKWTDRNKSSAVLWPLTQSRDPQLLARIDSLAGNALLEMARWRNNGWAYGARVILARIAGIPEERVAILAEGPLNAFLAATGH